MKQLQWAQLRLESQQQVMQTEMHRMEKALTAKLDALLAALQSREAPGVPGSGSACAAPDHGARLASVPEPEAFAEELELVTEHEGVPVCINRDVAEGGAPGEHKTLRVKLADMPRANPIASALGDRPSR